jgi:transcriptional regulator of acetoin/glycerol metabolism
MVQDMNKETWARFVAHEPVDLGNLAPDIADSWYKCAQSNINPYQAKATLVVDYRELAKEQRQDILQEFAAAFQTVKAWLDPSDDPLLVLADAQGRILKRTGSLKVQRQADEIGFGEGSVWTNRQVGTNAIGLALIHHKVSAVSRYQHYVTLSQKWTCFADVITDETGQCRGIIDLSFHNTFPVEKGKQLISMIAQKMSVALMQERVLAQQAILQYVLDNAHSPAVICDLQQRVCHKPGRLAALEGIQVGKVLPTESNRINLSRPQPIYQGEQQIGWQYSVTQSVARPQKFYYSGIATQSPVYQDFLAKVQLAAASDVPIHLFGETGSGKEVIAKSLHNNSPFKAGPLVTVNCGALNDDLLQSELFGYAPGAFTGASSKGYIGKIHQAQGGTLFLDEVNSMSAKMQSALLRVLEDNMVTPIGSDKKEKIHFRLVTASNQDLRELVQAGDFRMDLFYRIYVCGLVVPPLRAHLEDLRPLLDNFCSQRQWQISWVDQLLQVAKTYHWPGNVREFNNFLQRLYLYFQETKPTLAQLQEALNMGRFAGPSDPTAVPVPEPVGATVSGAQVSQRLSEMDRIVTALDQNDYHLQQTALELGMSRSTLYRRMKQYHLKVKR